MNTLPNNFLGLPAEYSDYRKAKFAVLPVPYDSTTSFQAGTREGPGAIIRASQQVELFDEELGTEAYKVGVTTLEPLLPNMAGPKAMHEDVFAAARKVVKDGKFLIGLGGEHGITSGLIRAVMTRHKKLSVLQIDAHLDLRDSWEGSPHSHACVMRRAIDLERNRRAGGNPQRFAGGASLLQESQDRADHGEELPLSDDTWMDQVLNRLGPTVYVTIDVDGFDPAYAPGSGTPEPGGLDWYDVTDLLRCVAAEKTIVAADIVEVMPIPGQAVTEFLAARLAYKTISYVQGDGR